MLAYIWWHQRQRDETREEYLTKLIAFHRLLQEQHPSGFCFSYSRLLELAGLPRMAARLPWMAKDREVYEDWYLLQGVEDMEEVALRMIYEVIDIRQKPHQQAQHLAAGNGTGQIYYGESECNTDVLAARLSQMRYATWFRWPDNSLRPWSRNELLLRNGVQQQGMLWWRESTPGEYYLYSVQPPVLPKELRRECEQMNMNRIASA